MPPTAPPLMSRAEITTPEALSEESVVELRNRDVEGVAELVFEGANDLAAVLEGLGVGDSELDG